MKYKLVFTLLLSIGSLMNSCAKDSTSRTDSESYKKTAELSLKNAETIFDYAYPLVLMRISQDLMFTVPFRESSHPNEFIMFKKLAKPENKAVVLGNRNSLYCVGWIDLSKGPVVFETPDMGKRYYVMPLIDAWTNTFKSIGSRTTGQKAQKYFIVNKEWSGKVPKGYSKVVSPTNMVWITGRIQADNDKDALLVNKLQDKYVLENYSKKLSGIDPFENYKPEFKAVWVRKPVPYSLKMDADDFYDTFLSQWAYNDSLKDDTKILKIMTAAGIKRNVKEFDDLDDNVQKVLEEALHKKQKQYLADFYKGRSQKDTWIFNTSAMGTWGIDYKKRAYWAVWGLGANLTQDAVYGVSQLDSQLKQLMGSDVYKIHFNKGATPKVGGFWSITAYDNEGYLEANDESRYASGSNMNLSYNKDGSLDLYMSHVKPSGVSEYNWIPTPKAEFKIIFRMYWPRKYILQGKYKLPEIVKMNKKNIYRAH